MSNLIFVSGLAVLLGGVIWGITSILHPNNYEPNATASRFWKPAIGGQAISYLLLVLGMVGLHVRQAELAGILGDRLYLGAVRLCPHFRHQSQYDLFASSAQCPATNA